jgi:hypothetical protein
MAEVSASARLGGLHHRYFWSVNLLEYMIHDHNQLIDRVAPIATFLPIAK